MKSQLLKLSAICLALAICGSAMGQASIKTATLQMTPTIPTIDGVVDAMWADVIVHKIERNHPNQTISMIDGVAPTWQACWDATNTYVLVIVPDDHCYTSVEAGVAGWLADKPEVYFDVNEEKVEDPAFGPSTYDSGHFQFAPDFPDLDGTNPASTAYDAAFTIDANDAGYIFEYAIPHASMKDKDGTTFAPSDGLVIGFDVTILDLDDDGKGANIAIGRANWSNDMYDDGNFATSGLPESGESWLDMTKSGDLTYSKESIGKTVAAFTASKTNIGLGETVQFTDLSTNSPTSWLWNFGDGYTSILQNPTHSYQNSGVYTVSLKVTKLGSTDTKTNPSLITVSQQRVAPIAEFNADTTVIIIGNTVSFTDLSLNTPNEWLWVFGDGGISTAQNPKYKYNSTGVFNVSLTAKNAAGSNVEEKNNYISVLEPVPIADFVVNELFIEVGKPVSFIDQTTNNPKSWFWDFGDGTTSTTQNPDHIYNTTGSYTISLTATNNTGSNKLSKVDYITIVSIPLPVALFEANSTTIEIGTAVTFSDQSTNNPVSWLWDFGDGTTSTTQNPIHICNTSGFFTISLKVTNAGGSNTLVKENYLNVVVTDVKNVSESMIKVFPNPSQGTFNLKVDKNIKTELSVQIIDATCKVVFTRHKIAAAIEKIDLSSYPKGIYFMQISRDNYLQTEKLVVN